MNGAGLIRPLVTRANRYLTFAFDGVASSITHFVSFEMCGIDHSTWLCFLTALRHGSLIAVFRMKMVVYVAMEFGRAMKPRTGANKDTT